MVILSYDGVILSYDGELNFGLVGDYNELPDLDTVGAAIATDLHCLVSLASKAARDVPSRCDGVT